MQELNRRRKRRSRGIMRRRRRRNDFFALGSRRHESLGDPQLVYQYVELVWLHLKRQLFHAATAAILVRLGVDCELEVYQGTQVA